MRIESIVQVQSMQRLVIVSLLLGSLSGCATYREKRTTTGYDPNPWRTTSIEGSLVTFRGWPALYSNKDNEGESIFGGRSKLDAKIYDVYVKKAGTEAHAPESIIQPPRDCELTRAIYLLDDKELTLQHNCDFDLQNLYPDILAVLSISTTDGTSAAAVILSFAAGTVRFESGRHSLVISGITLAPTQGSLFGARIKISAETVAGANTGPLANTAVEMHVATKSAPTVNGQK